MKRLSIKAKVTLWYSALVAVIIAALLIFLFIVSDLRLHEDIYERLEDAAAETYFSTEVSHGELKFDDDVDYFMDGIYISVYDEHRDLLYGMIPQGFSGGDFIPDSAYQLEQNGKTWSIFDEAFNIDDYGKIYIRAITTDDIHSSFKVVISIALYTLPLLLALCAIVGYFITKRAFLPVTQITAAADSINEGKDLSKRIALEGSDEIAHLANTFDQMFDRLEKNFEAEKRFTSDASHELRTPTAVIIAQCEYALSSTASVDEYRSSLEIILNQSRKMSGLISQLLALSRADRGIAKLSIEEVNLSDLCELTSDQLIEKAAEKGIAIHKEIAADVIMAGDETMLMRLLINLITNAITYGRENGNIYITLDSYDDTIVGAVRDDGIGISPENLPHIWDRFYQVDPSRSNDSAGLGLSMVKWIIAAHGGCIDVESRLGEGTAFTFYLTKSAALS